MTDIMLTEKMLIGESTRKIAFPPKKDRQIDRRPDIISYRVASLRINSYKIALLLKNVWTYTNIYFLVAKLFNNYKNTSVRILYTFMGKCHVLSP